MTKFVFRVLCFDSYIRLWYDFFSINSENELNLIRLGVVHLRHLLCDILRTRNSFSVIVTVNIVQLFIIISKPMFLPRDAMHKRGLCRHAVSVRQSVCLSRSWIMSKRIKISSKFFHLLVATPF